MVERIKIYQAMDTDIITKLDTSVVACGLLTGFVDSERNIQCNITRLMLCDMALSSNNISLYQFPL